MKQVIGPALTTAPAPWRRRAWPQPAESTDRGSAMYLATRGHVHSHDPSPEEPPLSSLRVTLVAPPWQSLAPPPAAA
jgi:hypothetical protein